MSIAEIDLDSAVEAALVDSTRITPKETDEVRELKIVVDDPAFRVMAGQNIAVVVEGDKAFGTRPHVRRYSVADVDNQQLEEKVGFSILVRRCFYIDDINGEQYPGVASNFLCDAQPGQKLTLLGPYKAPFKIPSSSDANLLMIGTGTGIAPFRGFIKRIYQQGTNWQGKVRLFYGARNGMDLLYMNDHNDDLTNYYDEETFKAFTALSERPLSDEREALEQSMVSHIDEAWDLINQPNTYVFLSGLHKAAEATDAVMIEKAGSEEAWAKIKKRLQDEGRWSELLYS